MSHLHFSQTLQQRHPQLAIEIVEATASTNADLMARARCAGIDAPVLLLALHQTAGRGRLGRRWQSCAQCSLTYSLGWRFDLPAEACRGLSLAAGVAIAEALNLFLTTAHHRVSLKWPNDLWLEQKKLGGILVETQAVRPALRKEVTTSQTIAIIGVGINLLPLPSMAEPSDYAVAALAEYANEPINTIDLITEMLSQLVTAMQQFAEHGFGYFQNRFNALLALKEQEVNILEQGRVVHRGLVQGIDPQGYLLLKDGEKCVRLASGELSLRVCT